MAVGFPALNFLHPWHAQRSALGHRWILQAYPSTWVHKYGNARNNQNPMLLGPTDAIHDNAKRHGVSVRAYGERGANTFNPPNATWTDFYNDWKNGTNLVSVDARAIIVGLRDVYHPKYPAATERVPDVYRADIFLKEFAEFEKNGNPPQLSILLLYADHTAGTSPGFPTPRAQVADNDVALGKIVEVISKSRYWKDSAIFVTEDDSQDGLDHVDGHRTLGFIVSPYTQRGGVVDSTFYTIVNMYRTIQQILGLPQLNQFDVAAEPMFTVFTSKPDFAPYTARPNQIALEEMNPPLAGLTGLQREMVEFSQTIDFSEPDSGPADKLNRAIWHSVKGWDTPYNYGRPIVRRHASFESLLRLAGSQALLDFTRTIMMRLVEACRRRAQREPGRATAPWLHHRCNRREPRPFDAIGTRSSPRARVACRHGEPVPIRAYRIHHLSHRSVRCPAGGCVGTSGRLD